MRHILAAGLLAVLSTACLDAGITGVGDDGTGDEGGDVGGGSGSGAGSGASSTPRVAASIDKASVTTELGKTETLTVTLTSENGFAGSIPVTPDAASAMAGFTITATPTTVDLAAGGTATVTIAVTVPTDAATLSPKLDIALGDATPVTVSSTFTIAQQLVVDIPAGLGTGSHITQLPAGAPVRVRAGTKVVFHNSDGIVHRIHGDGGIPHESTTDANAGQPNTDYTVTVTDSGDWYCHDHEGGGQSRFINLVP